MGYSVGYVFCVDCIGLKCHRFNTDIAVLIWWRGKDLNLRPSGYEPDELPDCSTPLLEEKERILTFWSERPGSNRRPSAWKADALPTELLSPLQSPYIDVKNLFCQYISLKRMIILYHKIDIDSHLSG